MPIFRVQVFYKKGLLEKWTNVYHVVAAGILDAATGVGTAMPTHLIAILATSCTLDKIVVSDPASAAYVEIPLGLAGTNGDTGSLLPLFNSVKVRFPTTAVGRPDYKFIKGFVGENMQTDGMLEAGQMAFVDTQLTQMLVDGGTSSITFSSESGDTWTSAIVQQAVQMRQMHRKRKKTVVPL